MTSPRAIKLIKRHLDLTNAETVLDYGCGDQSFKPHFLALGYRYAGWDVDHAEAPQAADLVNLSYVLNVIPTAAERGEVLARAWACSREAMVITIPPGFRFAQESKWCRKSSDDLLAGRGNFANLESENQAWLEAHIETQVIPLAPDVFLCLRDGARVKKSTLANLVASGASQLLPRRKTLALMATMIGGVFTFSATPSIAQPQNAHDRITSILMDILNLEAIDIRSESEIVDDLGADSLDKVSIIMALENEFELEIPDGNAENIKTVNDIYDYIGIYAK